MRLNLLSLAVSNLRFVEYEYWLALNARAREKSEVRSERSSPDRHFSQIVYGVQMSALFLISTN